MLKPGTCAIKSEYIIKNPVREVALECVSDQDKLKFNNEQQNDNVFQENCNEPQAKVMRLSKKAKKLKGQNKSRNPPFKVNRSEELCQTLVDLLESEERSCTNENCCYMHDRKEYLKNKPTDIGEECYNFITTGRCIRGVACRFGSSHITETGYNKIDEEKYKLFKERPSSCSNFLNGELLRQLRKREYDFSRSVKVVEKDKQQKKPDLNQEKCPTSDDIPIKTSGIVTDEDFIKLRKVEKKKVDWNDKLYLSPLTTLGNLPFRRICKEFGADITCGEMAMCSSLLQGSTQEWALVKRHETEDLFGVQLCGNNPFVFAKCAQLIQDQMDVNFVDINLGCPIEGVYQEGSGSGLLRRSNVLSSVVRCTSEILNVPLTAKIRIGIYSSQRIAHILLPNLKECGTNMVTIHGRSREQRYTKLADWNYIEECAKLVSPFPIYGNGDILSYNDYSFVKDHYKSVTGVMIGRGALIKPWIFTEIKEQRLWDISSSERFSLLKRFVNYGLEHWGSDMKGVENTRRFLLEWLSFLYRYIPVGLLENPPQKINERPPFYRGRDDLETLMASPSCTDWIKISEMLLGPVPKDFHFLPKHKANSYKEYEK